MSYLIKEAACLGKNFLFCLALFQVSQNSYADSDKGPGIQIPVVTEVQPTEVYPLEKGLQAFEITFSDDMDTSTNPDVCLNLALPSNVQCISASPGWLADGRTWRGVIQIQDPIPDGTHTLRIEGALSADFIPMDPDTQHRIKIDKESSGLVLTGGMVIAQTQDSLTLSWMPTAGFDIINFRIVRSLEESGPYKERAVIPATVVGASVTTFTDMGLDPDTLYWYKVYEELIALHQITQLHLSFSGRTLSGSNTPTNTPALSTPTPSPRPTAMDPDFDGNDDGVINDEDLIQFLRNWQHIVPLKAN